MKSENDIRSEVKKYLKLHGWFVFWNYQGNYRCYKGISDLIAIKNGIVLFIELKTEIGKLRSEQEQFSKDIIDAGGHYIIARSWVDVFDYICSLGE